MRLQVAGILGLATLSLASSISSVHGRRATETDNDVRNPPVTDKGDGQIECGGNMGSCPYGKCCNEHGKCGTGPTYCGGPQCQIQFSGGRCDANMQPGGDTTEKGVKRPWDGVPYGKYLTQCVNKKHIALTFDDGPYTYTDELLDILAWAKVKVTFFITGNNYGKGPIDSDRYPWRKILKRIHAEGHQLASHTWTHQNLSESPKHIREDQIFSLEMAFRNIFGFFPRYMRPPFGSCSRDSGCLDFITKLGYHLVTWSLDTKDFDYLKHDEIHHAEERFTQGLDRWSKTDGGPIVLAHDTHKETVVTLTKYMLREIKDRGLKPVTVAECLGETDPKNWYFDASHTRRGDSSSYDDPDSPSDGSQKVKVSKDGTCGWRSDFKFKCNGSKFGNCCSYNGWCGSSSAYCDGGCLKDFGRCNEIPEGKVVVSQNGLCGEMWRQTCQGSKYGHCCSKYNFCGNTDAYCGAKCQKGYGDGCHE